MAARAFSLADKLALARAFEALMRPVAQDATETLGAMAQAQRADRGRHQSLLGLVIASALNADIDSIALPYAAKVIRELFMNSARRGAWG